MKSSEQSRQESQLQEKQLNRVRLITAVCLGAVIGVFSGILAMALGILLITLLGLWIDTSVLRWPGLNMAAVTFVIFFTIGTIGATTLFCRQTKR